MGSSIFNIVVGLVMLVGGLTGKMALLGTDSSVALSVVGGLITAYGVWGLYKSRKG